MLYHKIDTLRPEVSLVYKAHLQGLCGLFLYAGLGLVPKANFNIKICRMVAQFLAHKPVNSALLNDSFIVSDANTGNTKQLSGPREVTGTFEKRAPGHGNIPCLLRAPRPAATGVIWRENVIAVAILLQVLARIS